MISKQHRFIFIHIPKTGGTSIESVIWPWSNGRDASMLYKGFVGEFHNKYQTGGLQHLLARQVREEVGRKTFAACYKFAMVRNPWDKVISQFVFMGKREDLRRYLGFSASDGLKKYLELIQKKLHVQWEHQHKFVLDDNGDKLVDHIARFEDYGTEVSTLFRRLDLNASGPDASQLDIPHLKKTDRGPYRSYFDDESREMVASIYKTDIDVFGYEF